MTDALEALPAKWRARLCDPKAYPKGECGDHDCRTLVDVADALEAALADRCSVAKDMIDAIYRCSFDGDECERHVWDDDSPGKRPEQPAGGA